MLLLLVWSLIPLTFNEIILHFTLDCIVYRLPKLKKRKKLNNQYTKRSLNLPIIIITNNLRDDGNTQTTHKQKRKAFKRWFDLRPYSFEIFPHVKTQINARQFSTYPTVNCSNDLELI